MKIRVKLNSTTKPKMVVKVRIFKVTYLDRKTITHRLVQTPHNVVFMHPTLK